MICCRSDTNYGGVGNVSYTPFLNKGKKMAKIETIKTNAKPIWKIGKGHNQHRSGSGVHLDRRTKRVRTRSAQKRAALADY
jgi:hypothetical protein